MSISTAGQVVSTLLEDDGHSEHMKGWDRVRKWDGAHSSMQDLLALERKKSVTMHELGQAIALDRALAHYGLERRDASNYITGDTVGATDNYKQEVPATACRNRQCSQNRVPIKNHSQEGCAACGEPLGTVMRRIMPIELRMKYARWILGVKTKDGRTIWFKEPVPPRGYVPREKEIPPS